MIREINDCGDRRGAEQFTENSLGILITNPVCVLGADAVEKFARMRGGKITDHEVVATFVFE